MKKILLIKQTVFITLLPIGILLLASSAASQECEADSDCNDEEYCQLGPMYEMCQNPTPDQEWACEGEFLEEVRGDCTPIADRCEEDADCDEYYICSKDGFGMSEGCGGVDDGGDVEPCEARSVSYESQYGVCRPGPIECESDDDCPAPLVCLEDSASGFCWASSDGETGCDEVIKTCGHEPIECETDDDCDSNSECVEVGSYIDCSNMDVIAIPEPDPADAPPADQGIPEEEAATPACPEGDDECLKEMELPDRPVDPMETDCEQIAEKACMPIRVDCSDDDECDEGEQCTDFSELRDYPTWWEDGQDAVACMPLGLVAVFEGHAQGGIGEFFAMTGRGDLVMPAAGDPGTENQTVSTDGEDDEGGNASEPAEETTDESEDEDKGGCSVIPGHKGSPMNFLLLIGSIFGIGLIRRRFN